MGSANLIQALIVTAEVMGSELSEVAAKVMVRDLRGCDEDAVLRALERCRRKGGRLTLGAIFDQLASSDGRPGADEAWAIASRAGDEAHTVVWTEEMAAAFGVVSELVIASDMTAARMGFRDAYREACEASRERGEPVHWQVSPGTDATGRADAIKQAVELKRLPASALGEAPQLEEWRAVLPPPSKAELEQFCGPPPDVKALIANIGKGVSR